MTIRLIKIIKTFVFSPPNRSGTKLETLARNDKNLPSLNKQNTKDRVFIILMRRFSNYLYIIIIRKLGEFY